MSDGSADVSRRGFVRLAAGGAAGSAAVGTAAAQEDGGNETEGGDNETGAGGNETGGGGNETGGGGNESDGGGGGGGGGGGPPDFGGFLSDANNYGGSAEDMTGQDEVSVAVGAGDGLAFGPAAVHVDNGATVVWEWTGEGGQHNVIAEDGTFESGPPVAEEGNTYEYTFEEDGIYNYVCDPHEGSGMLGSVVVGTDYPTLEPAGPSGPEVPDAAKSLGIAASVVMLATLGLSYVFMKFGGDYGELEE